MSVSIKIDTKQLERDVAKLSESVRKQIPFATALALTRTAMVARDMLKSTLASTFDNPTPWIKRSAEMERATPATLTAAVGIRDKGARATQATYIKEHFSGGQRGQKPYERALVGMGLLPGGYVTVPGDDVKLDRYGNISRKDLAEIFGAIKTRMNLYKGRGKRMQRVGYFIVKPGDSDPRTKHLSPGIWRRRMTYATGDYGDRPPIAVLLFVRSATYKKVIDLPKIGKTAIDTEFRRQFSKALDQAIRTAK